MGCVHIIVRVTSAQAASRVMLHTAAAERIPANQAAVVVMNPLHSDSAELPQNNAHESIAAGEGEEKVSNEDALDPDEPPPAPPSPRTLRRQFSANLKAQIQQNIEAAASAPSPSLEAPPAAQPSSSLPRHLKGLSGYQSPFLSYAHASPPSSVGTDHASHVQSGIIVKHGAGRSTTPQGQTQTDNVSMRLPFQPSTSRES